MSRLALTLLLCSGCSPSIEARSQGDWVPDLKALEGEERLKGAEARAKAFATRLRRTAAEHERYTFGAERCALDGRQVPCKVVHTDHRDVVYQIEGERLRLRFAKEAVTLIRGDRRLPLRRAEPVGD